MTDFNTTECLQAIDLITSADSVLTAIAAFTAFVFGIFIASLYSNIRAIKNNIADSDSHGI